MIIQLAALGPYQKIVLKVFSEDKLPRFFLTSYYLMLVYITARDFNLER